MLGGLEDKQFAFSSGAGGWGTTLAEDGDVLKGYCLVNDKSDHVFCTGSE